MSIQSVSSKLLWPKWSVRRKKRIAFLQLQYRLCGRTMSIRWSMH